MTQFYPDSGIHDTALYQRVAHPLRERDRQTDTALYQRVTLPLHLLSLLLINRPTALYQRVTLPLHLLVCRYICTHITTSIYIYVHIYERERQTDRHGIVSESHTSIAFTLSFAISIGLFCHINRPLLPYK